MVRINFYIHTILCILNWTKPNGISFLFKPVLKIVGLQLVIPNLESDEVNSTGEEKHDCGYVSEDLTRGWLNHLINSLWSNFNPYVGQMVLNELWPKIHAEKLANTTWEFLDMTDFDIGDKPVKFKSIEILKFLEDELIIDIELKYVGGKSSWNARAVHVGQSMASL